MSNANNFKATPVNLTTSRVAIATPNTERKAILIYNAGPGIATVYLKDELNAGIPIAVGAGLSFDKQCVPSNGFDAVSASTSALSVWTA